MTLGLLTKAGNQFFIGAILNFLIYSIMWIPEFFCHCRGKGRHAFIWLMWILCSAKMNKDENKQN